MRRKSRKSNLLFNKDKVVSTVLIPFLLPHYELDMDDESSITRFEEEVFGIAEVQCSFDEFKMMISKVVYYMHKIERIAQGMKIILPLL